MSTRVKQYFMKPGTNFITYDSIPRANIYTRKIFKAIELLTNEFGDPRRATSHQGSEAYDCASWLVSQEDAPILPGLGL